MITCETLLRQIDDQENRRRVADLYTVIYVNRTYIISVLNTKFSVLKNKFIIKVANLCLNYFFSAHSLVLSWIFSYDPSTQMHKVGFGILSNKKQTLK